MPRELDNNRLLKGLLHDLHNLVFGLSATIDVLSSRLQTSPEHLPAVKMLESEIDTFRRTVDELEELYRGVKLEVTEVALAPLLESAKQQIEAFAVKSGVTVALSPGDGARRVKVDELRFARIVRDFGEFAVQRSIRGQKVTLKVEKGALIIEDEAMLPADRVKELFEPFGPKKRGGSGLTFAVARAVLEELGGTISAESGASGTKITLTLPPA
jgi:two-component system, OmpR family, sensor kinase